MFDDFTAFDIEVSGTTNHGRKGGDGPPCYSCTESPSPTSCGIE